MEREGEEWKVHLLAGEVNGEAQATVNGGNSPLLLFSVFIAVCSSFASGCAMGYSSPVESAIMEELGLSTAEFSFFGSVLTIGGLVGSLVAGRIADFIGRRGAMGLADTLGILGWIIVATSKKAWSLDLGRVFIGISLGLVAYVVPVYISEITPKSVRGRLVSLSQLMQSCGLVVMFFAGDMIPWRVLVLIGIIPSLVQLLGLFVIPESPRFLVKHGHSGAHKAVLQRLRGDNIDISQEATEIEEFNERLKHIADVQFWGLFKRKYAHALIVVFGLMALSGLGGSTGITFYASSILEAAGFSSSIGSIGIAVIQVPSSFIGVYLIDKCGRRPLLMVSAAAMSFCGLLVAFMFLLEENNWLGNVSPYLIVLGLWGYSAAFPFGMGAIPYIIMSEIFPMNVKGSAGSLGIVVTCVACWVVTYSFNFATEWSYSGAFFIIAAINALAVVFTAKLVPETKDRTLEEIQESLSTHLLTTTELD